MPAAKKKPHGRVPGTQDPMKTKVKVPGTRDRNTIKDLRKLRPRKERRA